MSVCIGQAARVGSGQQYIDAAVITTCGERRRHLKLQGQIQILGWWTLVALTFIRKRYKWFSMDAGGARRDC